MACSASPAATAVAIIRAAHICSTPVRDFRRMCSDSSSLAATQLPDSLAGLLGPGLPLWDEVNSLCS